MKLRKQNNMLNECGRCKYKAHLVGLGLGVRCTHPNNQKYKLEEDGKTMPIIITRVPSPCFFKETRQRKKMILHIPHSSTYVPETFKVLEGVSLEREFQRMTDWFTDEIFDFEEAVKLVFPYSRLYCDVERFRKERDETMVRKGMGVCYTSTSYGTKLREVSSKERVFIKSAIYDKHHKKLKSLVEEELYEIGSSLIIDCHSFPNEILAQHNESDTRPDICLGTDSFHTPIELVEYIRKYFEKNGLSVAINKPFAGTMVPIKYYHKDKRVKSIMIEVNRNLYLNEKFERNEKFDEIKQLINDVLNFINKANFF